MTTAFVLSGGTNLGAVQVGMAAALAEAGIAPDLVVGTSVGALNGAWLAARRPLVGLEERWLQLHRRDIFPLNPVGVIAALSGRRSHLVAPRRLRRLVTDQLAFAALENAPIPFTVIATDALTGSAVALDSGPAVEALMASSAIPGVFPPVEIDGRTLVDGGLADNASIGTALVAGADDVWVLAAGWGCPVETGRGAVAAATSAALSLVHQRLALELAALSPARRSQVRVLPSPCMAGRSPLDFSRSGDLMAAARRETAAWLEAGAAPMGPPTYLP
ncbi:MAG: patatin-like phospholipase family protein [Acidimicrobiales bacterium]